MLCQCTSKKLKVREAISATEVPSSVIKKPVISTVAWILRTSRSNISGSAVICWFFSRVTFFETWQLEASFLILIFSTVYVQNVEKSLGLSHFYFHYLLLVWTKLSDRYTVLFLLFNLILFEILSCTLLFLCRGLNSFDFPFIEAAKNQRVPTQKGARLIC